MVNSELAEMILLNRVPYTAPLLPALNYKTRILGPKIEEFPFAVHKLSRLQIALHYKPQ